MCFAIRNVQHLENLRSEYRDDPVLLDVIEREAKWSLRENYLPPDVQTVEPDRVVPADFGKRRTFAAAFATA